MAKFVQIIPAHKKEFTSAMTKVAIYARVSTGTREQLDSLANQVSFFAQKIYGTGYERIVDIYIDVRSGQDVGKRSEFDRMLDDAMYGKFSKIYTKSVSRFGRDQLEALITVRKLKENSVNVFFHQENINSLYDAELKLSIALGFAEAENESRRKDQLVAINHRLNDGTSEIFNRPCYGYRKNNKGKLEIYEPEAKIVRFVYHLYLKGATIQQIQNRLALNGVLTARDKSSWSKQAISKMLTNGKYTGTFTVPYAQGQKKGQIEYGGVQIEGNNPPIISKEIFEAVQKEHEKRSNVTVDIYGRHRAKTRYKTIYNPEKDDDAISE